MCSIFNDDFLKIYDTFNYDENLYISTHCEGS